VFNLFCLCGFKMVVLVVDVQHFRDVIDYGHDGGSVGGLTVLG